MVCEVHGGLEGREEGGRGETFKDARDNRIGGGDSIQDEMAPLRNNIR